MSMAAEAETFKLSTMPHIGIIKKSSAASITSSEIPACSVPNTSANLPFVTSKVSGVALQRCGVVLHVDPLLRATHDVYRGVELTSILNSVYLLNAKGLAVTHNCAGILGMEHILCHDAHIVCAAIQSAAKYLLALLCEKLTHILEALLKPLA